MSNNISNNNRGFVDLFVGDDKYVAGLLIIIANVVGFLIHFRKARYSEVQAYTILIVVIIIASLLAKI